MTLLRRFDEFWPQYLREHARPLTRRLHFAGTSLGLLCLAGAALLGEPRLVAAAPVVAYGFAWTGHFFVERNRPATFRHPVLSLLGDFRMYGLMWAGRMDGEVERVAARISRRSRPS